MLKFCWHPINHLHFLRQSRDVAVCIFSKPQNSVILPLLNWFSSWICIKYVPLGVNQQQSRLINLYKPGLCIPKLKPSPVYILARIKKTFVSTYIRSNHGFWFEVSGLQKAMTHLVLDDQKIYSGDLVIQAIF